MNSQPIPRYQYQQCVYVITPLLNNICACRSRQQSACSCEHRARLAKYDSAGDQRTPLPSVEYSSLPPTKGGRTTSRDRKANNYIFFSSTRRKSLQFFGITVEAATLFCCLYPFSGWLRRYTSQTSSTRLLFSVVHGPKSELCILHNLARRSQQVFFYEGGVGQIVNFTYM